MKKPQLPLASYDAERIHLYSYHATQDGREETPVPGCDEVMLQKGFRVNPKEECDWSIDYVTCPECIKLHDAQLEWMEEQEEGLKKPFTKPEDFWKLFPPQSDMFFTYEQVAAAMSITLEDLYEMFPVVGLDNTDDLVADVIGAKRIFELAQEKFSEPTLHHLISKLDLVVKARLAKGYSLGRIQLP